MKERQRIVHSIPPTYDERSQVLVLGTMPSPASRELGFNYGHPRNRFWPVMAQLAGEPVPATNERKRDFCLRHHIALWDVLAECEIKGASDASITGVVPNRLTDITHAAPIQAVFCTGAKSYELYNRLCADEVGIPAVKLPSTSPANAACGMDELLHAYAAVLEHTDPLPAMTLDVPDVVSLEHTIAEAGTSLAELMSRAGAAVALRAREALEEVGKGTYSLRRINLEAEATMPLVVILCGNGNNGGDGWVAAQLLVEEGVPVCLVTGKLPDDITAQPAHDAAVVSLEALQAHGARVVRPSDGLPLDNAGALAHVPLVLLDEGTDADRQVVYDLLARAHVVVDAMLGTGGAMTPRQPLLEWVCATNRTRDGHAIIAVDMPTGVSAHDGTTSEACICADETLSMIVRKPGQVAVECGRVHVVPLAYLEPLL